MGKVILYHIQCIIKRINKLKYFDLIKSQENPDQDQWKDKGTAKKF